MNPFHININSMFLWKMHFKIPMRRETLFLYNFVNLFNVWLNGRQLDSHICFCFQSVAICCFG